MAAELVTPVDHLTGLPLPIVETAPPMWENYPADWHHPFHPKPSPIFKTLGGNALRHCRVQKLPYEIHHHLYHGQFAGPELPEAELDQFRFVVMAAAGYIPESALTFNQSREPHLISLTPDMRRELWDSRLLRVESTGAVREFLTAYALNQDLNGISSNKIDEFMHTRNDRRRQQLGDTFLGIAVQQATDPIKFVYKEAKKAELIPADKARAASRFMLTSLCFRRQRTKLYVRLREKLAA